MKTIEIFVVSVLRVILVFIARSSRTFPQDFGRYRWIARVIYPVASAMYHRALAPGHPAGLPIKKANPCARPTGR
jgi:hypothetical protein